MYNRFPTYMFVFSLQLYIKVEFISNSKVNGVGALWFIYSKLLFLEQSSVLIVMQTSLQSR